MASSDSEAVTSAAADGAPGALLAAAREAQGISQREMADRLNWMPSYVGALENNRFEELRNPTFGRGYLRAYGKLVGVPESQLMAAYEALPTVDDADKERTRKVNRTVPQVQKIGLAIPAGIALAVVLVLLLWLLRGDDSSETMAQPPVAQAADEAVEVAENTTPAVPPVAAVDSAAAPTPAVVVENETADAEPPGPVVSTAVVATQPEVAPARPVESAVGVDEVVLPEPANAVAGAEPALQFRFSGACWVEVRDAAAELIYADLHDAGDTLELSGQAPFDVLVGDAGVVTLAFEGTAVPIRSRPGRSIARFTVGE